MDKTPSQKVRPAASSRKSLDRKAWTQAALDALAETGLAGLRVEVLAKRCGVTKGSFYWHFRNRDELLDAVLAQWKEGRIRDATKQAHCDKGREIEQIARVIALYSSPRNQRGMQIELAVRDWAKRDARAAAVVGEVDLCRLQSAKQLFIAAGLPEAEAASRSLLLYAYAFGLSLMIVERFDPDVAHLHAAITDLIAHGKPPIALP